jgi:hypothetical protein
LLRLLLLIGGRGHRLVWRRLVRLLLLVRRGRLLVRLLLLVEAAGSRHGVRLPGQILLTLVSSVTRIARDHRLLRRGLLLVRQRSRLLVWSDLLAGILRDWRFRWRSLCLVRRGLCLVRQGLLLIRRGCLPVHRRVKRRLSGQRGLQACRQRGDGIRELPVGILKILRPPGQETAQIFHLPGKITQLAACLGYLGIQALTLANLPIQVGLQGSDAAVHLVQLVRGLLQLRA